MYIWDLRVTLTMRQFIPHLVYSGKVKFNAGFLGDRESAKVAMHGISSYVSSLRLRETCLTVGTGQTKILSQAVWSLSLPGENMIRSCKPGGHRSIESQTVEILSLACIMDWLLVWYPVSRSPYSTNRVTIVARDCHEFRWKVLIHSRLSGKCGSWQLVHSSHESAIGVILGALECIVGCCSCSWNSHYLILLTFPNSPQPSAEIIGNRKKAARISDTAFSKSLSESEVYITNTPVW